LTLPEQLQPPTVLHPLQRADIFSLRMPLSLIHQFREHFAPHCLPVLFLLFPHQSFEKNPLTPSFPASFFPAATKFFQLLRCHPMQFTVNPPSPGAAQPPLPSSPSLLSSLRPCQTLLEVPCCTFNRQHFEEVPFSGSGVPFADMTPSLSSSHREEGASSVPSATSSSV